MQTSRQFNKKPLFLHAKTRQRVKSACIAIALLSFWAIFFLAANDKINLGRFFGPCGFKQNYNLPCPTCGMTTATVNFANGKIFKAYYIQPAAALICTIMTFMLFFSFITAVFGIYFSFLSSFAKEIKIKYVFIILFIIILAGWAVTFTRAVAERG